MNEIICPNCKKAFKIDEAGFADILKQVRDHEFEEELNKREKLLAADKENAVKLAEERTKNKLNDDLSKKESEIATLKAEKESAVALLKSQKDAELAEIKAKLNSAETEKTLAVAQAVTIIEKERDSLRSGVGFYYDRSNRVLYFCPVPTMVFKFWREQE